MKSPPKWDPIGLDRPLFERMVAMSLKAVRPAPSKAPKPAAKPAAKPDAAQAERRSEVSEVGMGQNYTTMGPQV